MDLSHVINEIVEEKGVEKSSITEIVSKSLLEIYERKYPEVKFDISYDLKSDTLKILSERKIVKTAQDELLEISQRKAKVENPKADLGDVIKTDFKGSIGRVDVAKLKSLIAQKLQLLEGEMVYELFKDKVGSIVHGVIHKTGSSGVVVRVDDALAFLPRSLSIPGENFSVGHALRAVLKEVSLEATSENQLILDRASTEFVKGIMELEIPEIFERIIEIKKIVRIPGYKSKIVVASKEENIDPVGTCIGVGGSRIKPVLRELGAEKIDIIRHSEFLEDSIKNALKPAEIDKVKVSSDGKSVDVWLREDQRAFAIGKGGKNIMLASQLIGLQINLVDEEKMDEKEEKMENLFEEDDAKDEKDAKDDKTAETGGVDE